jgi:hypothetical protein
VRFVPSGASWMRLQRLENYRRRDIGFTVIMHYPDQTKATRDKGIYEIHYSIDGKNVYGTLLY